MAENRTLLGEHHRLLWLLACSLAAFLATLAGFELQAWVWPPYETAAFSQAEAALSAPHGAEKISEEEINGMPIPSGAREVYALSKPDPWGGRFQAFYEADMTADAVIAFYRRFMPQRGWRLDSGFSSALSQAEAGRNLAFTRGQQRFLVTVFEAETDTGCDFRVSLLNRPAPAGRVNAAATGSRLQQGSRADRTAWSEE